MSISELANIVLASIQALGYINFVILLVIDIVLFRLHPVLGLLAVIATAGYLFGWF